MKTRSGKVLYNNYKAEEQDVVQASCSKTDNNRKPWRKILYEKQDYPDNYSGPEFLLELKTNGKNSKRSRLKPDESEFRNSFQLRRSRIRLEKQLEDHCLLSIRLLPYCSTCHFLP